MSEISMMTYAQGPLTSNCPTTYGVFTNGSELFPQEFIAL